MNRLIFLIIVIVLNLIHVSAAEIDNWTGIEQTLQKDSLKILDIGNSYTDDATALLPLITSASGSDISNMCLYKAIRPSGSFKSWYDTYYDRDFNNYYIQKVLGEISANVTTGTGEAFDGALFRETLTDEQWDVIIIHQVSGFAPYYEQWNGTNAGGYLNEILDLIKSHQPQAAIGFLLIHSYWSGYWGNTEKSSFDRWQLIANSAKKLLEDKKVDFIIPYGTAVQNLRNSSLNNGYDLTRDGTHLDYGLARYTAACCYYQSIIYTRSGISILGNTARHDVSQQNSEYPSVTVDDKNAETAQKVAVLATIYPYFCLNPSDFDKIMKADLDCDGRITVEDVTKLIEIYLKRQLKVGSIN